MEDKKNQEPTEQQLLEMMNYGVKFYNIVLFLSCIIYITYVLVSKNTSEHFFSIMIYLAVIIEGCILRGKYKLMQKTTRYNTEKIKLEDFTKTFISSINMTRILKFFILILIVFNLFAGSGFTKIFLLSTIFVACILSMVINKTAVAYLEKLKS